MSWLHHLLLPDGASTYAREVDDLFFFVLWVSAAFFSIIGGLLILCAVRYRRRHDGEQTPHVTNNFALELTWSVIPLFLLMIIFFRGFLGFTALAKTPVNADEIQVTAHQFEWQFDHPNGIREFNHLHVQAGRPVHLVMHSLDVIHSFFIPDFRIKQDVLPNRYSTLSFLPEQPAEHTVFCAEYCGTAHSNMWAKLTVQSDSDYRDWVRVGGAASQEVPLASSGRTLFVDRSCAVCHSPKTDVLYGPGLKGLFGALVTLSDGRIVEADESYLRESILVPHAKIVAGFPDMMPPFAGTLTEHEVNALIAYLKQLK